VCSKLKWDTMSLNNVARAMAVLSSFILYNHIVCLTEVVVVYDCMHRERCAPPLGSGAEGGC